MSLDNPETPSPLNIIRSPCVRVCRFSEDDGTCLGCLRTKDEVRNWFGKTAEEKLAIIDSLAERQRLRMARKKAGG